MMEMMMTQNFSRFCQDFSLKDMLEFSENAVSTEDISSLDQMVCDVMTEDGMERLRQELMEDPLVQEIMLPVSDFYYRSFQPCTHIILCIS